LVLGSTLDDVGIALFLLCIPVSYNVTLHEAHIEPLPTRF